MINSEEKLNGAIAHLWGIKILGIETSFQNHHFSIILDPAFCITKKLEFKCVTELSFKDYNAVDFECLELTDIGAKILDHDQIEVCISLSGIESIIVLKCREIILDGNSLL